MKQIKQHYVFLMPEKIKLIYLTFDEFLDIVARDNYRDWDVSLKVLKALKNPQESEMLRKFFMPI